ncbi:MAG: hypothetical protein OEV53_13320 [Nitrospira sp.]|nr:hypothetical protein [Nitrospira sp.]
MLDGLNESLDVPGEISSGPEFNCVELGQSVKACRQVIRAWHPGVAHQHGYDSYALGKGGFDFEPDPIAGMIDTPRASGVPPRKPFVSNEYKKNARSPDGVSYRLCKINARLNIINVAKDLIASEMGSETIVNRARCVVSVIPPVRDKDRAVHSGAPEA